MPLLAGAHLLAGVVGGATEVVELSSTGVDLSYDVTEITAKPGDTITMRYTNASEMAHNLVLLKAEDDIDVVGNASFQAYANNWIPEDETDRIIAHTKVAGPGEVVEMTFVVPSSGTYPYYLHLLGSLDGDAGAPDFGPLTPPACGESDRFQVPLQSGRQPWCPCFGILTRGRLERWPLSPSYCLSQCRD